MYIHTSRNRVAMLPEQSKMERNSVQVIGLIILIVGIEMEITLQYLFDFILKMIGDAKTLKGVDQIHGVNHFGIWSC